MVFNQYGSSDVLEFKTVKKPVPKDNEVLVKLCTVSINDWDWGLLRGKPFVNRMMAGMFKPSRITILGSDIAGQVVAIGEDVTEFKVGDNPVLCEARLSTEYVAEKPLPCPKVAAK